MFHRNKKISEWFTEIEEGDLTIPGSQRSEIGQPEQIAGYFEFFLENRKPPTGASVILEVDNNTRIPSRTRKGAQTRPSRPAMNLIGGEQWIEPIWRSLTDNYPGFTFFLSLKQEEKPKIRIARCLDKEKGRWPKWTYNLMECIRRLIIPLSILRPGSEGERDFERWICVARPPIQVIMKIRKLREHVASCQIPFLSFPDSTEPETVLDVDIDGV